jgi:hypothetical protein
MIPYAQRVLSVLPLTSGWFAERIRIPAEGKPIKGVLPAGIGSIELIL